MQITFARVRASEAAQLSAFATENFDQTYGPLCRAADVDAYMAEELTPSALLRVLTSPTSWVFVVLVDNEWAGYTHVRLSALPDNVSSRLPAGIGTTPMEVARFYVSRKWHGKGVAARLLEHVLSHAQTHGSPTLWLAMWQENDRAGAFYQKAGFITIGTSKFLMGEDLQDDFIMERAVEKPVTQQVDAHHAA